MKLTVLLAGSSFLVLLLHIAVSRLLGKLARDISPQVVALCCAVGGNLPMAALIWLVALQYLTHDPFELLWAALYCLLVYNAFAYAYFHLFNMSETARRIHLLVELNRRGSIPTAATDAVYSATDALSSRLDRLVTLGQITRRGELYVLNNHGLYHAAGLVAIWARLLGFEWRKT